MGKTVFSAKLCQERKELVIAAHFTRHDSTRMSSPKHMIASLVRVIDGARLAC